MRKDYLDHLRALSIVGVVIIHTASPLMNMNFTINWPNWWIGNIYNSIFRFSVPVFLMLTGATLLGKKESYSTFIIKRYSRILFPFLFWIPFYYIFRWWALNPDSKQVNALDISGWISTVFLTEGISKHFWYIYMLFFLYPLLPVISTLIAKSNTKIIFLIIMVWVVLSQFSIGKNLNPYNWEGNYTSKLIGFLLYTGYMLLGYFIDNLKEKRNYSLLAKIIFILTVIVSAAGAFMMSKASGRHNLAIFSYLHLNTILQAASVFYIIKSLQTFKSWYLFIIHLLSKYSYGIYIVHIMVLGILWNYGIYWKIAHPIFSILGITILAIIVPVIVLFLLNKTPLINKISGIK